MTGAAAFNQTHSVLGNTTQILLYWRRALPDYWRNTMVRHLMMFVCVMCMQIGLAHAAQQSGHQQNRVERGSSEQSYRLTCSFIAEQCRVECPKRASSVLCSGYCRSKQDSCLVTGRWDGLVQQFENVDRR